MLCEQLAKKEIQDGTLLASSVYVTESHTFQLALTYFQWMEACLLVNCVGLE